VNSDSFCSDESNVVRPVNLLFVHAGAELYGADRVLLELLSGLKTEGYGLHVVLPSAGPLVKEVEKLGVSVHCKNLGVLRRKYMTPLGLLNRSCRVFSAVLVLKKMIRRHQIDVVHSNTTAVFSGVIAARLAGVKHVWHVHEITTRPSWFARLIAHSVGALTDKAVFVSQASLKHMCALSSSVRAKAVLIHNGIDDTRALEGKPGVMRSENAWNESNLIVGMVGRINWWKGQGKLIDCAIGLEKTLPQLRYLMVGGVFEGETTIRESLIQRIESHDMTSKIVLQDFRSDIGNVLADLDVFVLPSTEPDPFPTVVLEAMAAGKAIVGFRHGGVCEMVEDGITGLLCDPCDIEQMKEAITRLVTSPTLARTMGLAGRKRLDTLFTRSAFIKRFSDLYHDLARG
jgi:glycosyltransferase involved in cell wall biosynthesis